jgi:serine/threonine protein kinase
MDCPRCHLKTAVTARFCQQCGLALAPYLITTERNSHSDISAQADPLVGRVLDSKYEIVARLGEGGMGIVYRARRILLGDDVAIKILHSKYVSDKTALERFHREAQAAAILNHRNVVSIFDFGSSKSSDTPAYIVMQLVPGETLRRILQRENVLSPKRACHLMLEICAGVAAAHRSNVVHRDIKPDNIIVSPPYENETDESVKVVDFGIAKLRDLDSGSPLTETGAVIGTPLYMSPEQCRGDSMDLRSDVYSLGAMFYEMLSGDPPFKAKLASILASSHLSELPPPFPEELQIPTSLAEIVKRALSKLPDDRQETAGRLAQEIRSIEESSQEIGRGNTSEPAMPVKRKGHWNEYSFFEEASKGLNPDELASVRKLYQFSAKYARVTWGSGNKNGSFNVKFDHIDSKSLYSVFTDGALILNFQWLGDNPASAGMAKQFGLQLAQIPGFNIPRNFSQKYIGIPLVRWAHQIDEFIRVVDTIARIQIPDYEDDGDDQIIPDGKEIDASRRAARNILPELLAKRGFQVLDWRETARSAEFVAYHPETNVTLNVNLKGRLCFERRLISKGLYIAFPADGEWYLYPHDVLLETVLAETNIGSTNSWLRGIYHWPRLSRKLRQLLKPYNVMSMELPVHPAAPPSELTPDRKQVMVEQFWDGFDSRYMARNSRVKLNSVYIPEGGGGKSWRNSTIVRSGFKLAVQIDASTNQADVNITIGPSLLLWFLELYSKRRETNLELGAKADWKLNPEGESWAIIRRQFQLAEQESWGEIYDWLLVTLELFFDVFTEKIEALVI